MLFALHCALHQSARPLVIQQPLVQKLKVRHHRRQQVVVVKRDAARELAQSLQLLALSQGRLRVLQVTLACLGVRQIPANCDEADPAWIGHDRPLDRLVVPHLCEDAVLLVRGKPSFFHPSERCRGRIKILVMDEFDIGRAQHLVLGEARKARTGRADGQHATGIIRVGQHVGRQRPQLVTLGGARCQLCIASPFGRDVAASAVDKASLGTPTQDSQWTRPSLPRYLFWNWNTGFPCQRPNKTVSCALHVFGMQHVPD